MTGLNIGKKIFAALLVSSILALVACGSKLEGTYTDASGAIMLELKSGGKAELTFMGETGQCTYKVDGKSVMLNCRGDNTVFTIHDDGSLTGPPGSFIGVLKKSK